jgi:ankyrin repeat protein
MTSVRTSPQFSVSIESIDLLLSLGVSPDVEDEQGARALHRAAGGNARDAAAALLARGADPDARERQWNATPLGFASHHDHRDMLALLAPVSHDVWTLAQNGFVDRLREVLTAAPALARGFDRQGCTPLWWLPQDDTRAVQVVELFLASGADAAHVAPDGSTAEALARRRGLTQAAARLATVTMPRP